MLSELDLAKLRAHLASVQKHGGCPVCGSTEWSASGPEIAAGNWEPGGTVTRFRAIPLVVLVCKRCFYVRHFAWVPMERSGSALLGLPTDEGGGVG